MYIYNRKNPLHKKPCNEAVDLPKSVRFGKSLGAWENELDPGEYIVELVIGGAKSYSYRTNFGKIVIKLKGVTLDKANSEIVTFENMKQMVLNHTEEEVTRSVKNKMKLNPTKEQIESGYIEKDFSIKTARRFTFAWIQSTKEVVTKFISKSIRSTVSSKRTVVGYETRPFGFVEKET